MPTPPTLAGLVLCGGSSRRMGADKAQLEIEGEPLLHRVAGRLARLCHPVLVAPGTPGRLGPLPWPEVADAGGTGAGPLAGLVAGLEASPRAWVAAVAVDLPLVDVDLLAWLHDHRRGEAAVVPVDDEGRPQPLHAVYPRAAAPALRAALAGGRTRLVDAVLATGATLVAVGAAADRRWSFNLNQPADLAVLARLLESPPAPPASGAPGEGSDTPLTSP